VVVARREDDLAGRPDLGHAALEHGAKAVIDRFVNLVQDDKGSSARSSQGSGRWTDRLTVRLPTGAMIARALPLVPAAGDRHTGRSQERVEAR
jgi:hypothetical protein